MAKRVIVTKREWARERSPENVRAHLSCYTVAHYGKPKWVRRKRKWVLQNPIGLLRMTRGYSEFGSDFRCLL